MGAILGSMYDPSMRVLTVLELLQAKEQISGAELARQLEVSSRTVQRYIARLQDLGFPVESSRGVGGSYRLKPGFRLPPMMFSTEEALALSLGLEALAHLGLTDFTPAMQTAKGKLERVLPKATRQQVQDMQAALGLEASTWVVPTNAEVVIGLAKAMQAQQPVAFAYTSFEGQLSQREVEPYGVLHHERRWYMVGHCRTRQALRVFRADRMGKLETLEGSFVPPNSFDPRAFLLESLPFAASKWQIEVWLDLPPDEARWRLYDHQVLLEAEGDGTRLRCGTGDLEWFAAVLLKLQCEFQIRQPKELREALVELGERAKRLALFTSF
jgi:predicted DNA-binding transcriptional regulator YafY